MRSGRFQKRLDETMERLNASIAFDRRLYAEDIQGSLAWAQALRGSGFLSKEEAEKICEGLKRIE
ncbi:MAG: argininosuccinate lyase, partial [Planctomycetes bacterium]|nr:argininosuccinate lyase [Planctomycetota bacterium]